ncbi:MAG: hemolysin family protein [Myxococcales bacterium]
MLELVAAGAALIGRALLQGEDAAVLAVSEQDLRDAATEPHLATSARRVLELKSDPEATAAALRAAGSGLLAFAAVACAIWVNGVLTRAGIARASMSSATLQLLAGIFAGVVALVLDLAPRSLAAARPLRWSLALSSPAWFLCKTLKWPLQLLLRIFDTLLLGSGATARYTPPPPPLEQIERILTGEGRAGEKAAPPPELVHGLFEFAEKTAKEVMVPRTNVVGVPVGSTVDDVLALLAEEGHTRMPVFEDDLDHIKGVLHTKDVIPLLANPELIVLQDLIRPAVWVPWTKRVDEILREMQQKRSHIVMVADEYGGLSGIVTLEDVLELVVGELGEERRPVELPVPPLGPDGTTLVRAETRIEEVNEALGAELPRDGGFETLAGLLNSCAGAIPQTGDRFYVGGLELTVLQRDDRRVRLVRISKASATQPPPAS